MNELASLAPLVVLAVAGFGVSSAHAQLRPQVAARLCLAWLVIGAAAVLPVLIVFSAGLLGYQPVFGAGVHDAAHAAGFHLSSTPLAGGIALALLGGTAWRWVGLLRQRRALWVTESAGVLVVSSPEVYAFTNPGPGGAITVSRGLVDLLDHDQLAAVLAHETSHARNRHDRLLIAGHLCAAVAPVFIPLLRRLEFSLERWADRDAAHRVGSSEQVAATLAKVAVGGSVRSMALGIGGVGVAARLEALLAPQRPLTPAGLGFLWGLTASAAVLVLAQWQGSGELLRVLCGR